MREAQKSGGIQVVSEHAVELSDGRAVEFVISEMFDAVRSRNADSKILWNTLRLHVEQQEMFGYSMPGLQVQMHVLVEKPETDPHMMIINALTNSQSTSTRHRQEGQNR